ncbi:hypothetical protein MMC26_002730 [Xylographa opegraphella]|nr:hypothetical protein [Xylographa opegraphella]
MAEEVAAKRLKISPPLIGTHNGHFHADEALAVYLLRLLPTYTPSSLLRTRDPALLSTCHTVVDVGGEYSPSTNRYDHHQRTFSTTFPNHSTKLSSAGLVYMHFGKPIIASRTALPADSPEVDLLYEKLYTEFVEALDANDNGISAYDPADTVNLKKRFHDGGVTLGSLVNDLNHEWNDDPLHEQPPGHGDGTSFVKGTGPEQAQADEDARFLKASSLMGTTFLRKLSYYHLAWLPARKHVQTAHRNRFSNDPSGAIMVLDGGGVPWKDHLYAFETENADAPKVLYVLYPEGPNEGAKWRVQCVSVTKDSFESRKPLKEEWRGVRDSELSGKSGIDGCVFVHASGFIGGNLTKAGAMDMAKKSMLS